MAAVGPNGVADFLDWATVGPSGLVIEGEAGIGKTTLWLAGVEEARERGFRVLSAQPSAAESVQAYASLADVLSGINPITWSNLPGPQRLAIDQVLLRTESDTPVTDQRAVSAAFLSIISRLTDDSPVLLAIDDLQWLDPSSVLVLSFAVRRLTGPVGVLGAERTDPGVGSTGSWLRLSRPDAMRRIQVQPLSLGALHQVLSDRLGRTFPRPTISRIHDISGGNPFYAIELARVLHSGATISDADLPGTLAELVDARIGDLDPAVQQALLATSCAAAPTVELIARATGAEAAQVVRLLEHAESIGIIRINGRTIRFAHPLLAQGVYTNTKPAQRRAMHRRLSDIVEQPELQARHLALATTTYDPNTLRSLDEAAELAHRRGAPAAATELLDLAIGLGGDTPDRRILLASHHFDAGDLGRARALLEQTVDALPPGVRRAQALSLLAIVRMADEGFGQARDWFERALAESGEHVALRVHILLTVSYCHLSVGDLSAALCRVEDALLHAERLGEPQLLSQALGMRVFLGAVLGEGIDGPSMQRALDLENRDIYAHISVRPSFHNVSILAWSGRLDEALHEIGAIRAHCLERGEETEVIVAALPYVVCQVWRGNFADAAGAADDAMERALQAGGDHSLAIALTVSTTVHAFTGSVDDARRDSSAALTASKRGDLGVMPWWQLTMVGFLEASLGNYDAALRVLTPLLMAFTVAPQSTEALFGAFIPDAVEALVALGRLDEAEPLTTALERNGRRLDRPWMLAIGARCRAMMLAAQGDLEAANLIVQQAMTEHDRLPMPFERARTQLLAGQLQRRHRQKDIAATTLRQALLAFETMGASLWAERARAELDRVNVGPRQTTQLTPTEQQVAELAATGMTNRDVAAALFISPKTVEGNLSRVYHKLGIRSRAELGRRIGQANGGEA